MRRRAGGVRGAWLRHNLETRTKRLLRLERESPEDTAFVLSDQQIRLLERHSRRVPLPSRRVLTRPASCSNQDTFYWGTLKGVGKVYVQVVVDVFCSLAFAKVYNSKMPITACDLLYDRVLPFYEALGVPVGAILTDNGREFCGRPERHPYELLLAIEDIEHRNTKIRSPAHQRLRRAHEPHAARRRIRNSSDALNARSGNCVTVVLMIAHPR